MSKYLKWLLFFSAIFLYKEKLNAQYLLYNPIDTFYYFKEYSYHLKINQKDTTFFYLKLDLNSTDIQKISSKMYNGKCEFAQFYAEKNEGRIKVTLYDRDKQKIKTEIYTFLTNVIKTQEIYFLNLAGMEQKLYWNTIETRILK